MKITSFNINGIKARLPRLLAQVCLGTTSANGIMDLER
jgi:exonuclease III